MQIESDGLQLIAIELRQELRPDPGCAAVARRPNCAIGELVRNPQSHVLEADLMVRAWCAITDATAPGAMVTRRARVERPGHESELSLQIPRSESFDPLPHQLGARPVEAVMEFASRRQVEGGFVRTRPEERDVKRVQGILFRLDQRPPR